MPDVGEWLAEEEHGVYAPYQATFVYLLLRYFELFTVSGLGAWSFALACV